MVHNYKLEPISLPINLLKMLVKETLGSIFESIIRLINSLTISIIKHRIQIVSIHTIFNHSLAKYTIFKNQSLFLIYKNIYQAEDSAEEGCDSDNKRVEENFIIKPRSGTRIHLLRYFSSRIY